MGVVSDTRYRSLKDPIRPMYFTAQDDFESFVLNVRTTGRPEAIIGPVRHAAASIAPDLPFLEASTLSREIDQTTAPERSIAILSSLFALAAAGIAAIGTYGLLLYSVRQRRLEIGIRMAIGAQQTDIIKLIARQMFGMTIAGLTLGLVAALTTKPDAQSLTTAVLFVGFFAITAAIPPALQAIRIQPADSLRSPNL